MLELIIASFLVINTCYAQDRDLKEAWQLFSQGQEELERGDPQVALKKFIESFKICGENSNSPCIVDNLIRIGMTFLALGNEENAFKYLNMAVKVSKQNNLEERAAFSLSIIGSLYDEKDEYDRALEYYNEALKIYKEINNKERVASVLGPMGLDYFSLGDKNKALEFLKEALILHKELDNKELVALDDLTIGKLYLTWPSPDYMNAKLLINEALRIYKEIDSKKGIALSCYQLGELFNVSQEYSKALDLLRMSLSIAKDINDKLGILSVYEGMGWTYYNSGNYSEAIKCAKEALTMMIKNPHKDTYYSVNYLLASSYSKQNNLDLALQHYKTAIDTVESIRRRLKLEEQKIGFIGDKIGVYEGIVLLLLKLNKPDEALEYVERAKSQAFFDLLANKIKLKDSSPLDNSQIQELLDKDITLLEYYITENKLLIWIVSHSKINVVEVPIARKDLQNKVFLFRHSIKLESPDYENLAKKGLEKETDLSNIDPEDPELAYLISTGLIKSFDEFSNYREISKELYKLLIEPVRPYINTNKLCIVPYTFLHYLPFQTLLDGDRFLIEDYNIFYLTSANLLKLCFDKRKENRNTLLAFGNPDNSLRYAEEEVNEIRKSFSNATVFTKQDATETKFKTLSNNYSVIHFACHGHFNLATPLYSSLKLAKDEKEDGKLEVWEIFNMELPNTTLVTLSACNTALGAMRPGDELIGFTRAFLYAGSPSTITSLWLVQDESTSILMKELYTNLKTNSKIESLRLAQLRLIKSKPSLNSADKDKKTLILGNRSKSTQTDYSNPYYWAPFVLIGDWK